MNVSIVIPCFNGGNTIQRVLEAIDDISIPNAEIIIVDDCSSDGTQGLLKSKRSPLISKLIFHTKRQGKAAALRSGIASTTGSIIIIQEAAIVGSHFDYSILLDPIIKNNADVVYGSRSSKNSLNVDNFWSIIGDWLLTKISNMLTGTNLSDVNASCKAFRRELIESMELREKGSGSASELTAKFSKMKARFLELSMSYQGTTYNNHHVPKTNRAISWKDYLESISAILRYNLLTSAYKESTHKIKPYTKVSEAEIKEAA